MIILYFFILCTASSAVDNNVLKIQANNGFFQNLKGFIQQKVTEEVAAFRIPDQNIHVHIPGTWKLYNFHTVSMESPIIDNSLSDDNITFSSSGGSLHMEGKWRYVQRPFSHHDLVGIHIKGFLSTVSTKVITNNGRPQLQVVKCDCSLQHLDVRFHGSPGGYIINVFAPKFEKEIRKRMRNEGCAALTNFVHKHFNLPMAQIPTHYPLGKDFFLDWGVNTPTHNPNFVQLDGHATVVYGSYSCPDQEIIKFDDLTDSYMVNIWLSESFPNCALAAFQHSGSMNKLIDKNIPVLADYLKTSCSRLCIGSLIPQLAEKYPNNYIDFYANLVEPPKVSVISDGIRISGKETVAMHINPKSTHPDVLAQFSLSFDFTAIPSFSNGILHFETKDMNTKLVVEFSKIGDIPQMALKMASSFLAETATDYLTTVGKQGVKVPSFGKYKLSPESKIVLADKFIRLDLNITDTKGWFYIDKDF